MIMSILVYFRARPLTSILSPEGERKFWGGRAIRRGNNEEHSAWLTGACPLTSILSPRGRGSLGGRAIRRGNGHEHSALFTRARPLTSILSPEGERKFWRGLEILN